MEASLVTEVVQLDIWITPNGNDYGTPIYNQSFTAQSVINSMLEDGYIEDELVAAECREGGMDQMLVENACRMAGLPTYSYGTDLTECLEDEGKRLVVTYYRR